MTRHVVECQECRVKVKELGELLECATEISEASVDEQMCKSAKQAILAAAQEREKRALSPTIKVQMIRRTIMKSRITKLAAAAVIIVAVTVVVPQFIGSIESVAWAELADRVAQIRTCFFRGHTTVIIGADGENTQEMEAFVSSEYGFRSDIYQDDKLQMSQYVLLTEAVAISVMPEQKRYMRIVLTDEHLEKMQRQGNDPREMVKQFMSAEYTELGRDVIDGIEVEGIETTDPNVYGGVFENFVARLWVGVESDLPVRMEIETQMQAGDKTMQMSMVMDAFEWDVELDPAIFEPNIPADYNLMAEVEIPDTKDEGKLIQGLRSFAEIADGRYPSSMTMMAVIREAGGLFKSMGFDKNKEPTPEQTQRLTAKMMVLQAPYIFYAQLAQENKDPAYYGDEVTAEDADMVLMRWKVSDDEYRVIFGDLTTENVSAESLAELEALLPE
ncbi:MAG: hypothetical protein ACYTEL_08305 [Planctomycetota bacterium]